jgi:hypothetical protein
MKKGNKGKGCQDPLPIPPLQQTRTSAMADKGGTPKGTPPSSLAVQIPLWDKTTKEMTGSVKGAQAAPLE